MRSRLKNKAIHLLKKTIEFLESVYYKYTSDNLNDLAYSSLSPIHNGDENGHYSKALLWALENRKKEDIKNIALTGSYGSGKSSILKTFQKNYKGKDLKFLNISLATFKEESPKCDTNGNKITVDKTELLRLIETSILEQIFYHEEDNKIPDSRFKKIKSYSGTKLLLLSFGYLLFLLSLYNYFNPSFIQDIIKDVAISEQICNIIHYAGIAIILLGLYFIIFKSVRIISSLTINKLNIQNAEIGIGENTNKSILNHHIDEILYFFSIRPYNVIIIEDLDRFQETEIFTKLREVNLLLNNSEKTKRKEIVFVYAVRDDMFTDKERTKFFDFIIPVIPLINSSNSSEILLQKRNKFQYKLSDNFIEDISFFIDDMRLLHNISNEFFLYQEKLDKNLSQDKLFAIITYKNIYPNDFMKLSNNEGELYTIFNSKSIFTQKSISEIDIEIDSITKEIKKHEDIFLENINDLRLLYIVRVIDKLPGYQSIIINDTTLTLDAITENKNFDYIKTNNYRYNQYYSYNDTRKRDPDFKFFDIERKIGSYNLKEQQITDIQNGKVNALKERIQQLERKKQNVRNLKISELLQYNEFQEININENFNKNLISILIRNSYISEDYLDYISLFHEESITRADYQFHINIKNAIRLPYEYKLSKIDKLISKINVLDFQTEYILNFSLLDYLLAHSEKHNTQLDLVFNKLKDESKISIEFIKIYFQTTNEIKKFTEILCQKWHNIWNYIELNAGITESLKNAIFKHIIEHGNIIDIIEISKQSSFTKFIISNPLFLNITHDHSKLKKIIEELKLVFTQIDFKNSSDEMLSFIYQNNHYQLNIEMVISIIKKFGEFNQVEFDNSNNLAIKTSKADHLIQYIETNINDYIKNVYLRISTNINEKEESFIELLNNENIENDNKESIISQIKTKITKLSSINDSSLYSFLLEKSKVIPIWENLLFVYNSDNLKEKNNGENSEDRSTAIEISKSIITFINEISNARELSKVKIPKHVNQENIYSKFWKKLIQINDINDESYSLIIKSSPWRYSSLNFKNLSKNKIISLIDDNYIKPIAKSFNLIKESHEKLNIYLLEKRKDDFFKILDQLIFDSDDLEIILSSTLLNNTKKNKIINSCSNETIIANNNNLLRINSILLQDTTFKVNDTILTILLTNNNIPIVDRLQLFIINPDKHEDHNFIKNFLNNLGHDYAKITDTNSEAKISKEPLNLSLLKALIRINYISTYSILDKDYLVLHKKE